MHLHGAFIQCSLSLTLSRSHSHTLMDEDAMQGAKIKHQRRSSSLLKDTKKRSIEEPGIKPVTFRLQDGHYSGALERHGRLLKCSVCPPRLYVSFRLYYLTIQLICAKGDGLLRLQTSPCLWLVILFKPRPLFPANELIIRHDLT